MPKYRKKRFNYPPYQQAGFPGMQIAAPMPMYPFPIPIPGFTGPPPPPFVVPMKTPVIPAPPQPSQPAAIPKSKETVPPENKVDASKHISDTISRSERACLPFFDEEIKKTEPREPTDIVIIDFDRTLLSTPTVNKDLFDRSSRYTLEFRLGSGNGWWQSRPVLEAAIGQGHWNEELVSLAKEASANDDIVLVVTTARKTSEISIIKEALETRGIQNVDHFACSALTQHEEGEENGNSSESSMVSLSGWGKRAMLELLLESYPYLERVFIFDCNKSNKQKYARSVSQFVRDGWINAEALHLIDLPNEQPPPQLDLLAERSLVDQVLEFSDVPLTKSVVVIEWLHKLTLSTQEALSTIFHEHLNEHLDRIICEDINISKGTLPFDLRSLAQRGAQWKWAITGYRVDNRILWLELKTIKESQDESNQNVTGVTANPHTADFKAARLARGTEEETIHTALTALMHSVHIETFIYERRELHVQKNKA